MTYPPVNADDIATAIRGIEAALAPSIVKEFEHNVRERGLPVSAALDLVRKNADSLVKHAVSNAMNGPLAAALQAYQRERGE